MVWPFKKKEVQAVQQVQSQAPPAPQAPASKQKEEVLFQAGQVQPEAKPSRIREPRTAIRAARAARAKKHFYRKKIVHKKLAKHKLKFIKTKPQIRKEKNFRTAKINFLKMQIRSIQERVYTYETQIEKLTKLMEGIDNYVVVKFIEDMSWDKFQEANRMLNIKKDDVIYVDNTDTISKKALDYLRGKVTYILYRKSFNKALEAEKFIFIDASKLQFKKYEGFFVASAKDFEKLTRSKEVLQKLLMGI